MTDFEWLDSGPNGSEGHYSMHSKNPHFATPLYTTALATTSYTFHTFSGTFYTKVVLTIKWFPRALLKFVRKPGKDGRVEKTDPRSADYPLTPLHGLPYGLLHGLPYGLPLRTTLNNQPNSFYGVKKYKTPTCSNYTIITA